MEFLRMLSGWKRQQLMHFMKWVKSTKGYKTNKHRFVAHSAVDQVCILRAA